VALAAGVVREAPPWETPPRREKPKSTVVEVITTTPSGTAFTRPQRVPRPDVA
jgi:hypothetical protein